MSGLPDFTELGFGLGSLALIWVVVRYFIDTVNKKDTQISTMVESFNKTINNHIVHETAQSKKETASLNKLASAIIALTKKIEDKK